MQVTWQAAVGGLNSLTSKAAQRSAADCVSQKFQQTVTNFVGETNFVSETVELSKLVSETIELP